MIERVTHAYLGTIWYHSEPSGIPYSLNQFLGWDFFAASYRKTFLRAYCPNVDSLGTSQKRRRPAQRKGSAEQKDGSCRLKELYQQTKMSSQQAESKAQPQLVEIPSKGVFLFTCISAGN